jgi:hypothetical protein
MNVVPIHAGICKETEAVLVYLLARTREGKCRGVSCCADMQSEEEIVFTGNYRRRPSRGVNAAMRMSARLTQMQDDMEAISHR